MSIPGDGFIFDGQAFFADESVQMMSAEQVYIYIRLLHHQWQEGSIPDNPRQVAAVISEGFRTYTPASLQAPLPDPFEGSLWDGVLECFQPFEEEPPGRLANPRLAAERSAWVKKHRKWQEAGKKGGRGKKKTTTRAAGFASENTPPQPEPVNLAEATLKGASNHPLGTLNPSSPLPVPCPSPCPSSSKSEPVGFAAADDDELEFVSEVGALFREVSGRKKPLTPKERAVAVDWFVDGVSISELRALLPDRAARAVSTINSLHYFEAAVAECRRVSPEFDAQLMSAAPLESFDPVLRLRELAQILPEDVPHRSELVGSIEALADTESESPIEDIERSLERIEEQFLSQIELGPDQLDAINRSLGAVAFQSDVKESLEKQAKRALLKLPRLSLFG